MTARCGWVNEDPIYIRYHDEEWGVPVHDDRKLFEMLVLEGAQAGLSWYTVLKKRENYRAAFDGFDPHKLAAEGSEARMEAWLADAGIIRNRLKCQSVIDNARAYLQVAQKYGSFNDYIWQFTGGQPIQNQWEYPKEVPASTAESDAMSKSLKSHGFRFVGSTICYAYMQATGMVNDHLTTCFRHTECRSLTSN